MKIAMICFTLTGLETAEKIQAAMEQMEGIECSVAMKSLYLEGSISESVGQWTGEQFETQDGIIFIGATGIAVRSIAPYVVSKKKDPAVLVADECGKFVISLLSGHLGGANDLTRQVAEALGAVPVVTTATDLHDRFAVDVFAKKNDCQIFQMKAAKEVSAALLAGENVGFYSEIPYEGELPEGLILCDREGKPISKSDIERNPEKVMDEEKDQIGVSDTKGSSTAVFDKNQKISGRSDTCHKKILMSGEYFPKPEIGIAVTVRKDIQPFDVTTMVVPKVLAMGIGCRKGREAEGIRIAADACLERGSYYKEAIAVIASIDLKKDETGILSLSEEWKVPFVTYTEEELMKVPGEFTPSSFVKKITGVDNVCERSAVLAAECGTLLQKKVGADGVTTALAMRKGGLKF